MLELPGELITDPNKTASPSSPVAGTVDAVSFQEGSPVKRGQTLVSVRVPNFATTKADSAAAQARAQAARTNADRLTELAKRGFAANQEALTAKAEAEALDAQARAAGELLRAVGSAGDTVTSQLAVHAPMSRVVIQRDAIVGQAITPDTTLAAYASIARAFPGARLDHRLATAQATSSRGAVGSRSRRGARSHSEPAPARSAASNGGFA